MWFLCFAARTVKKCCHQAYPATNRASEIPTKSFADPY